VDNRRAPSRFLVPTLLVVTLAAAAVAAPDRPSSSRPTGPPAPDVIAVVDGVPIRQGEWDRLADPYFREVETRAGRKLTEEEKRLLRRNLLEELIRERLWLADARRRGMVVSEAVIDARMRESPFFKVDGKKVDEAKFLSFKRSPTSNYAALKAQVGMGLLIEEYTRWMERRFGPREPEVRKAFQERTAQATIRYFILGPDVASLEPEASLKQIRAYYEAHPQEFQAPDSARIQYVKVPIDAAPADSGRDGAAEAAQKSAMDLLAAIQSGAPVETAAKMYGGLHDTGWFRVAEPVRGLGRSEALQNAIRDATPGQWIKTPIRNGPQFLVVHLLERKATRLQSFREVAAVAKRQADRLLREGASDSLGREEVRLHPETYAVPRLWGTIVARAAASIGDGKPVTPKDVEKETDRRRKAAKIKSGNRAWVDSVKALVPEQLRRARRDETVARAFEEAITRLRKGEPGARAADPIGGVAEAFDLYRGQPIEAPMLVEGAFLDSLYTLRAGTVIGPRIVRDSVFVVRIDRNDPSFIPPYEAVRQSASSNAQMVKRWALEREAERYYESHRDDYRKKPEWIFDYVYFKKAKPESVAVAESTIVAYYHGHPLEFTAPAAAKPRIILVRYRPADGPDAREKGLQRALAARDRILKGEDFAAVAREVSDDRQSADQGGAIPEVTRSALMKELVDMIFTLPIGQVSEPVEAGSAFHLIRVDSRSEERLRTLEESRSEIQALFGEPLADSLALSAAARLAASVAAGGSFDSLAAREGGATRSEPIQAGEPLPGIGPFETVATAIGSLSDGSVTPEPVPIQGGYLVARRVREVAPAAAPFEEVKERVILDYQTARRRAVADSLDETIRAAVARGEDIEAIADGMGGMRSSRPFGRLGPILELARDPGLARDSTLLDRIFSSKPGRALPPVKSTLGTVYIVVESVTAPPAADFARRREEVWREIVDQRIEAWTARLRSRATVTLYRKDLRALATG
jgi:parvulin-like peptidyl-prolyl isomerase